MVATVLVIAAGAVHADDDDVDDDVDDRGELVPVRARARLVDGKTVVIDARFELTAHGPSSPPGNTREIALPHDAKITSARVTTGGVTRTLALVSHADADKALAVLSDPPTASGGRATAVRIDAAADTATIEVTVPRRTTVRLDLTLAVPACFADDARNVVIPRDWESVLSGGTQVRPDAFEALDTRCARTSEADDTWIAFPTRELAMRPFGAQRIGTDGARLPLGATDLARVEITLAKQLTTIPSDLHTVLVVDHSRSVTPDEANTQRAVIAAYLRAAPRGRVQLVGYARDARTLLPGWMTASQATARIDRELRGLLPRNGSNLDRGLAAAATLLATVHGTRRIIVFTDDRIAHRIENEVDTYARGLPENTLVHVVALDGAFDQRLQRDDDHALAALTKGTHGVAMRADLDEHGTIDALPLARPTTFDSVEIRAPGWADLTPQIECPGGDHFVEGTSCEWVGRGTPAAGAITIEGWLWGTKVTRTVMPDPREARALARLLDGAGSLPTELQQQVARVAQAVNDSWALVAVWGAGGYADQESWGTISTGRFGTIGHTIVDTVGVPTPARRRPHDELLAQLGASVRACKPHGAVVAEVELTREEIVDITLAFRDTRDQRLEECIANGIWDVSLVLVDPPSHLTAHLEFQP